MTTYELKSVFIRRVLNGFPMKPKNKQDQRLRDKYQIFNSIFLMIMMLLVLCMEFVVNKSLSDSSFVWIIVLGLIANLFYLISLIHKYTK